MISKTTNHQKRKTKMGNVIGIKGARELPANASRYDRATMDTIVVTPLLVESWKKPSFQRELRITPRVREAIAQIRRDGVVEGVITLGKFEGDTYLLDGQHRMEGLKLACDSEYLVEDPRRPGERLPVITEAYADVRVRNFKSMAEMAEEFINLNRPLVSMRPDDLMRGLEEVSPHIAAIRRRCPFVGYDRLRQGDNPKTLLSMGTIVRIWFGSAGETPSPGPSSPEAVKLLSEDQVDLLCEFLQICFEAWGRHKEHFKMWMGLNLCLLMWLYRRIVLADLSAQKGGRKLVHLTKREFMSCLMGLAADANYSESLVGRSLSERDRGPCYSRIRAIFVRRLTDAGISNPRFPAGDWTSS
jgi:hypothetical protein